MKIGPPYADSSLIYSGLTQERKLGPVLCNNFINSFFIFVVKSYVCISAGDNILLQPKSFAIKLCFSR